MANTRRENILEEKGRVDAEKAYTSKGKRNLHDEKSRLDRELTHGELSSPLKRRGITSRGKRRYQKGGRAGFKDGGRLDSLKMNKKGQPLTKHIKMAKGGHVKSRGKALRGGGAEIK
jgi:hypothetical protein